MSKNQMSFKTKVELGNWLSKESKNRNIGELMQLASEHFNRKVSYGQIKHTADAFDITIQRKSARIKTAKSNKCNTKEWRCDCGIRWRLHIYKLQGGKDEQRVEC